MHFNNSPFVAGSTIVFFFYTIMPAGELKSISLRLKDA